MIDIMKWIGVDEAGKGDYFGYLVIGGVLVDDESVKKLKEIGVKDSKLLSDSSVSKMAVKVKRICKHDIIRVSPEKYNLLYKKFKNLNKLLAWGHARVIENLLQKHAADHVITDKFGDEKFLKEALFERGYLNGHARELLHTDETAGAEPTDALRRARPWGKFWSRSG